MGPKTINGLFFFEEQLFAGSTTGGAARVCSILSSAFPKWSSKLRVSLDEEEVGVGISGCSALNGAIEKVCSRMIGPKWIVLSGVHDGVSVIMSSSRSLSVPDANTVSLYIREASEEGEGKDVEALASSVFREIVGSMCCRYARFSDVQEFRDKHLVTDAAGTRAVGVNLGEGLPGLYWLNYLGPRYVSLIGAHSIEQSEAERVEKVNSGYLLQLYPSASDWPSPVSRRAEAALKEHLGQQIFSLCADDGKGLVPDFKAPLPL